MLRKLNLYFGIGLAFAFLWSGYYMGEYLRPRYEDDLIIRMQYRSNHIYILYLSIINTFLYQYQTGNDRFLSKSLEWGIRTLPLIAGILAVVAFFREHTGDLDERLLTFIKVVLVFVSFNLFLLKELIIDRKRTV